MLYTFIFLLVSLWVVGLVRNFGGPYIHTLLLLAVAVSFVNVIGGRRSAKFE